VRVTIFESRLPMASFLWRMSESVDTGLIISEAFAIHFLVASVPSTPYRE